MFIRISGALVSVAGMSWAITNESNMALVLGCSMAALGAAIAIFGND